QQQTTTNNNKQQQTTTNNHKQQSRRQHPPDIAHQNIFRLLDNDLHPPVLRPPFGGFVRRTGFKFAFDQI
ncbi:MAG TPA: hypothetical protein P5158_14005, partial [Chitinophagaceae bacterium]|nr:hypothetical protein [Chitinophagaceae bacterium]